MRILGFEVQRANSNIASESLSFQDKLNQLLQGSSGWNDKFITDVYNEGPLDPHAEMNRSKRIMDYNGHVNAAVDSFADFCHAGSVDAKTEDRAAAEFASELLDSLGLREHAPMLFRQLLGLGNAYLERVDGVSKSGSRVPVYYRLQPSPHRVFFDLDEQGRVKRAILHTPGVTAGAAGVREWQINYDGRLRSVRGFELDWDRTLHLRIGSADLPQYGRGLVAPSVNDAAILFELERSMAMVARYKSIPKKLFHTPGVSDRGLDAFNQQLGSLGDNENPSTNVDEINVHDLSYQGQVLNYQPLVDYLRRKLTISIAPEFLIHGDLTTHAVSSDQREAANLRAKSKREAVSKAYETILREAFEAYGRSAPVDLKVEFGSFDAGESQEKAEQARADWLAGGLTLDEYRSALGLESADEELGGLYRFELERKAVDETQLLGSNQGG